MVDDGAKPGHASGSARTRLEAEDDEWGSVTELVRARASRTWSATICDELDWKSKI